MSRFTDLDLKDIEGFECLVDGNGNKYKSFTDLYNSFDEETKTFVDYIFEKQYQQQYDYENKPINNKLTIKFKDAIKAGVYSNLKEAYEKSKKAIFIFEHVDCEYLNKRTNEKINYRGILEDYKLTSNYLEIKTKPMPAAAFEYFLKECINLLEGRK